MYQRSAGTTTTIMSKPRHSSTTTAPQDPPPGYAIDPTAPPMLRYQSSLPSLPVPTLQSTCTKYLETVQPLLTPSEYTTTQSSVSQFLASPQAAELQRRLQERAATPGVQNWLSEWWDEVAYMAYRDPVVVFVSYFFVHIDDRTRRDPAKRAASLIKAMLPFRELTERYALLFSGHFYGNDKRKADDWNLTKYEAHRYACLRTNGSSTPHDTPLNHRTPRQSSTPRQTTTSSSSERTAFSSCPSRTPTAKNYPTLSLKRKSLLTCDSPLNLFVIFFFYTDNSTTSSLLQGQLRPLSQSAP
jgi:hypothetical protein